MSTGTRPDQLTIGIGRRPYPGLRAFRRDEADRFFGRDEQIDALLDQLAESRFLAVLGTSGSGKSSLVRAGLLPALNGGVLLREPDGDGPWPGTCWSIAELRPGERPFERLARALLKDTGWGEPLMARYGIECHGSEPAGDPPPPPMPTSGPPSLSPPTPSGDSSPTCAAVARPWAGCSASCPCRQGSGC